MFRENGRLCVNTLSLAHVSMAECCAGLHGTPPEERFASHLWKPTGPYGCPRLADALSVCEGRLHSVAEAGCHSVFFVEVDDIVLSQDLTIQPLIWHRRDFVTINSKTKQPGDQVDCPPGGD
jgi:flavin reductase (NADH)